VPRRGSVPEPRNGLYRRLAGCCLVAGAAVLGACSVPRDPIFSAAPEKISPAPELGAVPRNEHRNLLWGDVHIHTSLSYDAFVMGSRAMPDDAYASARGRAIEHAIGYPIQLGRPLDFAAVTDHAEYLGIARHLGINGAVEERTLRDLFAGGGRLAFTWHYLHTLITKMADREQRELDLGVPEYIPVSRAAWGEVIAAARRNNVPGTFTAFVGYEWSAIPNDENLHRNIIYADDRVPELPYSSRESNNPMDLWAELDRQRERGMDAIAIPHNGNSSNGRMYARRTYLGEPLDREYAEQRMRNEPISEIYQVKGSSESHPLLSPEDGFAGFELYDLRLSARGGLSEPRGGYARDALRTGLEFSHRERFNPYRFGVIGSSDSHNASSASEEDRHHGKLPMLDGAPSIRLRTRLLGPESMSRGSPWSSQGLAAVWARENTRESIFAAMRRRETFATSGPRMAVRFFAAWDYDESMLRDPRRLRLAYASGVPMGGVLEAAPAGGAPTVAVWATKDALGANLDRIQVIKAWIAPDGNSREKIYDVAVSDPDRRRRDGEVLPVGNTVDAGDATYSNSIGAAELAAVWRDPDFDRSAEAFYYARVIEIPTPRWSTFDAALLGLEPPEPVAIQERAVTSAIWYRPNGPDARRMP